MKNLIKSLIGGSLRLLSHFKKNDNLTIFCYHDVSDSPSEFSYKNDLNVPPNIFDYQVDFINKNFNVISSDDLLANNIPEHAALITFDDGFKSYFQTALPILETYNLPSIIFLNMSPIKGKVFWSGLISYLCEKSPEFYDHVISNTKVNLKEKPLILYCSEEIVNSFLSIKNRTFKNEVNNYVGDFATEKDLQSVTANKLVYFGNHLYTHEVPLLLKDKKLLDLYKKNEDELKKYPNYRKLFAFPFGQPNTSFSQRQVELLIENGSKKVFSAYPVINSDTSAPYLHRIPLNSFNNTKASIWFNILRRSSTWFRTDIY